MATADWLPPSGLELSSPGVSLPVSSASNGSGIGSSVGSWVAPGAGVLESTSLSGLSAGSAAFGSGGAVDSFGPVGAGSGVLPSSASSWCVLPGSFGFKHSGLSGGRLGLYLHTGVGGGVVGGGVVGGGVVGGTVGGGVVGGVVGGGVVGGVVGGTVGGIVGGGVFGGVVDGGVPGVVGGVSGGTVVVVGGVTTVGGPFFFCFGRGCDFGFCTTPVVGLVHSTSTPCPAPAAVRFASGSSLVFWSTFSGTVKRTRTCERPSAQSCRKLLPSPPRVLTRAPLIRTIGSEDAASPAASRALSRACESEMLELTTRMTLVSPPFFSCLARVVTPFQSVPSSLACWSMYWMYASRFSFGERCTQSTRSDQDVLSSPQSSVGAAYEAYVVWDPLMGLSEDAPGWTLVAEVATVDASPRYCGSLAGSHVRSPPQNREAMSTATNPTKSPSTCS